MIEESGRSRFGAVMYHRELFQSCSASRRSMPYPTWRADPSPEDERELRERLLKAGEQRAGEG